MWDLIFTVLAHPDKAKTGEFVEDDEIGHHDAHLSKQDQQNQAKALHEEQNALKHLFAVHGVEEFHDQLWFMFGPDIPDMILLKFLRARKWNVHRAFAMLCKCIQWRIESNVIDIVAKGDIGLTREDPKYGIQGPAAKAYSLGFSDNSLMPVISIHVKNHIASAQSADTITKFVISCAETFRTLVTYPNDKVIILFDLSGFGMKNMDWHALTTILKILEAYYPETLAKLYIHRAPWIFQGIWKALAPMLDPKVREKINFTGKPDELDLIPNYMLEDVLGGTQVDVMKWTEPQPGEKEGLPRDNPQRQKMWREYRGLSAQFEEITKQWVASDGQDDRLQDERDFHAKKLRLKFIDLDPYLRARNMYQRSGIITPDLLFDFTYKQKDGRQLKHIVGREFSRQGLEQAINEREMRSEKPKKRTSVARQDPAASSPDDSAVASGVGAGAAGAGAAGVGAGAAAMATKSRSRDGTSSRRSSRALTGEERQRRRASRQGQSVESGSRRREPKINEEDQVPRQRNVRSPAEQSERAQRRPPRASSETQSSRSNMAMGAGAGAGAGTAAAYRQRPSGPSEMFNANRQYRPRGGSAAPSIKSSMSDDVFVDADDFEDHDPHATYGPRGTQATGGRDANTNMYMDNEEEYDDEDEEPYEEETEPEPEPEPRRSSAAAGGARRSRASNQPRRRNLNQEENGDELAGFPKLANSEQKEEIVENNEKMREPFDPNAGRKKPSLITRLMCCGGKSA